MTVSAHGEDLRLEVADTGSGIPSEAIPHIFERFYRVDKALLGGAGLGLAIAERIVELHQGHIEVHSGFGKGARFYVDLPTRAPG